MMSDKISYRYLLMALALILTACLILPFNVSLTVSASDSQTGFVFDEADLLSEEETSELNELSADLSSRHNMGISIIVVEDYTTYQAGQTYNDIKDWQRAMFNTGSFSYGQSEDGIMLAISMEDRDWGIVTFGSAQDTFPSDIRERIGSQLISKLSDDDYYGAFTDYLTLADGYLTAEENGGNYSGEDVYTSSDASGDTIDLPIIIGSSFLFSLIVSLIIVLVWKKGMNTIVRQDNAGAYLKQDSVTLTTQSDLFLYHTISRTQRQQENHSSDMHSDYSGTSGKF